MKRPSYGRRPRKSDADGMGAKVRDDDWGDLGGCRSMFVVFRSRTAWRLRQLSSVVVEVGRCWSAGAITLQREQRSRCPMGSGPAAVEKARVAQRESADTDRHDPATSSMRTL